MAKIRQEERFGRITGNTLRRSAYSSFYTEQFVSKKRRYRPRADLSLPVDIEEDFIEGQLEEMLHDGDLQGSGHIYSLNKHRRWELPGLLKETICNDNLHQDLDFKVMLVEKHLDGHNIFKPVCTGLYETQTAQAEKLPRRRYAHEQDLHRRRDGGKAKEEALRRHINKIRCMKNRGGKKINWRGLMDTMREKMQEEEQRQEEASDAMSQICYEISYRRPENKYPWRPEMKANMCTSRGPRATKQRQKTSTTGFLEDTYNTDDINDDIFEEVLYYSEADSYIKEDATDDSLLNSENRPMPTLEDAFLGLAKTPKTRRCKKRRHKSKSNTEDQEKKYAANQATSNSVKMHDKGSFVYDPAAVTYKYLSMGPPHRAATQAPSAVREEKQMERLPSLSLLLEPDSLNPSTLEADFGKAYTQGHCMPQKFAIEACSTEDRQNSVCALFEYQRGDWTLAECKQSEEVINDWQMVKRGVPLRMTLKCWIEEFRTNFLIQDMAVMFPSTTVFSIQEVMIYLKDEIQKATSFCNKIQSREVYGKSRLTSSDTSSDIPTVRAAFGWQYSFSTADEAYRDMTNCQTNKPCYDTSIVKVEPQSDTCGICCETLASSTSDWGDAAGVTSADGLEGTALTSCSHWFCNDCWRRYIGSGVQQGITNISCPEYNCEIPVDPVTTMSFLSAAQFHGHYTRDRDTTLARSTRWHRCPNPHCGRIARVVEVMSDRGEETAMVIQCHCGWLWCTECKEQAHWPATCRQAEAYRPLVKRRLGLSQDNKPLITHVKVRKCPSCHTRWEKNGGCPSMMCGNCREQFCWNCLQTLRSHDNGVCNRSVANGEVIDLDYPESSKELMLEMAVEHHKSRLLSSQTMFWSLAVRLALKSVISHLSRQDQWTFHCNAAMLLSAVPPSGNVLPLTWANTKELLDMMTKRKAQCLEIAAFCQESNFVLEHLAFFIWGTPRRQRKATWWRSLSTLRFITQHLEQTLRNLQLIKRTETEATLDRLCKTMFAGKKCLRQLAHSINNASKTKCLGDRKK